MAIIKIEQEFTVGIVANQSSLILPAFNKRRSALIQIQAVGTAWVSFNAPAARNVGIRISGWQIYSLTADLSTVTRPYQGDVFIYWEGDAVDPITNRSFTLDALVRVIETRS